MNSGILNQNGEAFYPITQANLVRTSDGKNIEEKLTLSVDTITGTTTANGNLNLNINSTKYAIIAIWADYGTTAYVVNYYPSTNKVYQAHITKGSDNSNVSTTSVTLHYIKVPI